MLDKAVFHFDPQTGEYLSASIAVETSLERGKSLLPINATFDPPPNCSVHEIAVRVGDAWELRADWRSEKLYSTVDGSDVVIKEIGQTPADVDATEHPRPDETYVWKKGKWIADAGRQAEVKEKHQAMAWKAIQAERDHRTESGGFRIGEKWFHSDKVSRCQQINLAMLGDGIKPDLQWKTMDGTFVIMTANLAQQILSIASTSDQAIFAIAEMHKAAMLEADDPSSYDFSQGWPEKYE